MAYRDTSLIHRGIDDIADLFASVTDENSYCFAGCRLWELCMITHDGKQKYGDHASCKATFKKWLSGYNFDGRANASLKKVLDSKKKK